MTDPAALLSISEDYTKLVKDFRRAAAASSGETIFPALARHAELYQPLLEGDIKDRNRIDYGLNQMASMLSSQASLLGTFASEAMAGQEDPGLGTEEAQCRAFHDRVKSLQTEIRKLV